jgi:hypothetical protein
MSETAAEALMRAEMRVAYGRVPRTGLGEPLPEASWRLLGNEFLLRGEGEHYFYYRKGAGVTVERGPGADIDEESLWLNGSVYAAIASLNGLQPIHASAVAVGGRVVAFTAPAGGGKSTLVAALGKRGLPMFCDDTLVLDLADPDRIVCLPGHKRLKLRPDSLALTGARPQEPVSKTVDKVYALPAGGDVRVALPLAELIFLECGSEPAIHAIRGAERFVRTADDHYTSWLFAGAQALDCQAQFEHRARLARQIAMARFVRPLDPSRFDEGIALVAEYVSNRA